jgi:hypothetical protein
MAAFSTAMSVREAKDERHLPSGRAHPERNSRRGRHPPLETAQRVRAAGGNGGDRAARVSGRSRGCQFAGPLSVSEPPALDGGSRHRASHVARRTRHHNCRPEKRNDQLRDLDAAVHRVSRRVLAIFQAVFSLAVLACVAVFAWQYLGIFGGDRTPILGIPKAVAISGILATCAGLGIAFALNIIEGGKD